MTDSPTPRPALTGVGYALPANIRTNDDPIFDWLKAHFPEQKLFAGYEIRHVLSPNERLIDLMVPACRRALDDAGISERQIDLLIGYPSVSEYIVPNELARLHAELNLPAQAPIMALQNEFTNFNDAILLADALLRGGRCRNALLVCGCNWTRYVNYHTVPSVSAADGAGAAVMGMTEDPSRFFLADSQTEVKSELYGVMFVGPDAAPASTAGDPLFTAPYFHLTEAGVDAFKTFGVEEPPALAKRLLARSGLKGGDVTLISHQASSYLTDQWCAAIEPAQYINTLKTLANMTLATLPVNLAKCYAAIQKDWVLLLGLGAQLSITATLLRRNA
jgi:3-oxoacyl-[acyl-carrier-protein] synthase-3